MKTIILAAIFVPFTYFLGGGIEEVAKAIRNGDVETLANHFDEEIELAINDEEDLYDKATAKEMLAEFFASTSPKAFKIVHSGQAKSNAQYCIGDFTTGKGVYRVSFVTKGSGDDFLIQELRIEKE